MTRGNPHVVSQAIRRFKVVICTGLCVLVIVVGYQSTVKDGAVCEVAGSRPRLILSLLCPHHFPSLYVVFIPCEIPLAVPYCVLS